MINIYLSFKKDKIRFFKNQNLNIFSEKYNINFNSTLEESSTVFFLFNLGNPKLFTKELKHFKYDKKFDLSKEIKMIEYFIKLNKKIIIYLRNDGSTIYNSINNLIELYPNKILFVIKDYLLKEEKIYLTQSSNYGKYLIHKQFEKSNSREIQESFNLLKKYFCYTIPYNKKVGYGFVGKDYEYPKQEKIYDIFYIKKFREGQLNCLLRKKTLEQVLNLKDKYKICTDPCSKEDYKKKLLQSKICISTWGLGESLNDDYFCIVNDIIVLKLDTNHLNDFYHLFEKDILFHFYKIDFSNFELKIKMILDNYEYYYNLYNKKRQIIIDKYDKEFHIKVLADKINKKLNI